MEKMKVGVVCHNNNDAHGHHPLHVGIVKVVSPFFPPLLVYQVKTLNLPDWAATTMQVSSPPVWCHLR